MKYLIFAAFCAFSVPLMVWAAYTSERLCGVLLSALIFSTCLGPMSTIHLTTVEGYRGTEDGLIVVLTDVICFSLIAGMLLRYPHRMRWLPYNSGWLLAVFALAALSAAQATSPPLAGYALFTFIKAYAVFWCVYNCLAIGTSPIYLWYGCMAIGAVVSAYALEQRFVQHIPRVSAFFAHSNTLPSYCFLFLPFVLLWALCGPVLSNFQRQLTLVMVCGLSLAIVLTLSRAGIVLLGVMLLITLTLAWRRAPNARLRRRCAMLLSVMIFAGLALSAQVAHRFATAPEASGEARDEFNAAALAMAADHPLGVGPNNYSYSLSNLREYRRSLVVLRDESEAGVCHNIYLLTAAETGWFGLALLMFTLGRFIWNAWSAIGRSRRFEAVVLYGICIGWVAILANGSLEWVLRQSFVMNMYAIVAALSVCAAEALRNQRRAPARPGVIAIRGAASQPLSPAETEGKPSNVRYAKR